MMTFSVSMKDERCFAWDSNYKYSTARAILMKADGSYQYIKGAAGLPMRDLYVEFDSLDAGEYLLFAEIDWISGNRDFVITSYGKSKVEFVGDESAKIDRIELLGKCLKSKAIGGHPTVNHTDMSKHGEPEMKIWKDFSGDDGYAILYWKNGTKRVY